MSSRTVVILAGDIEVEKATSLVKAAFGSIPRRSAPPPPSLATSGPATEVRIDGSAAPDFAGVAWATPAFNTPGDAELDVAADILTARLEAKLVNSSYAASAASVYNHSRLGASSFRAIFTMRADHRPDEALRALDAELAAIREKGPSAEEVAVARERLMATMRPTDLTARAKIAWNCARLGYLGKCAEKIAARYAAIDPGEVRDATRALLPPNRRVVVAPSSGLGK